MEKCLLCTVPLPVNTQPKHSRRKKWSLKCFWTLVKESRDISTSQFPNLLSNQPLVLFKYASPLKGSSEKKKISDAGLVLYSKGRYKVQHCHKSAPQTPGHLQEGQHANVFWHLRVNPGSQSAQLVQKDTQQWPGVWLGLWKGLPLPSKTWRGLCHRVVGTPCHKQELLKCHQVCREQPASSERGGSCYRQHHVGKSSWKVPGTNRPRPEQGNDLPFPSTASSAANFYGRLHASD